MVVTDLIHPFTTVGEHHTHAPDAGAVSTAAWELEGEIVKILMTNVATAIRRDRFMSEGYP